LTYTDDSSIVKFVEVIFMGTDDYSKALASAEKELETLNVKADVIAQRRAQLQQTISALKTLMNISVQEDRTITDTIRIVVRAANGYISTEDIWTGVLAMGAKFTGKNALASIVTMLGRLHKDGELERDEAGRYRSKGAGDTLRNAYEQSLYEEKKPLTPGEAKQMMEKLRLKK
jgi:hypothetical protein